METKKNGENNDPTQADPTIHTALKAAQEWGGKRDTRSGRTGPHGGRQSRNGGNVVGGRCIGHQLVGWADATIWDGTRGSLYPLPAVQVFRRRNRSRPPLHRLLGLGCSHRPDGTGPGRCFVAAAIEVGTRPMNRNYPIIMRWTPPTRGRKATRRPEQQWETPRTRLRGLPARNKPTAHGKNSNRSENQDHHQLDH